MQSLEKIVFMCIFPPELDGSAISNYEFVSGLADRGYSVEVIAQPCQGDKMFDRRERADKGIEIHRVPFSLPYEGSPPSTEQIRTLSEYARNFLELNNPDLVVLGHDSWAWYEGVAHKLKIPVVQHLRGTPTRGITSGIYPPIETEQFLSHVRNADHVVTVSRNFADLAVSLGVSREKVTTMYNGIDLSLFNQKTPSDDFRKSLKIERKARVIAHTSNFYPVKRIGDIVDSAEQVIEDNPDVIYLLIGTGPTFEEIAEKVNKSRYAPHFRMVGHVPKSRVSDYLSLAQSFILSSETEGFPRATVEAQACGLYLIMSDNPAGIERTQNGTIGTMYRVGDHNDLAKKTKQVLSLSRPEFDLIRFDGMRFVQQYCDGKKQVEKYVSLLEDVHAKRIYGAQMLAR
jgi:glycosyltransferase involved in cell wall biosynthesis